MTKIGSLIAFILSLVDLHGMFLTALKRKPADRKTWLTGDGVHMNALGDGIMAAGVLRALGVPDAKIAASETVPPPVRPASRAKPAKAAAK